MTTIAYDGRVLVSDSQLHHGETMQPAPFRKIHIPEDDEYWEINGTKVIAFGLVGNPYTLNFIKDKLREGVDYKTKFEVPGNEEFEAILIDENGLSHMWVVINQKNEMVSSVIPMLPPLAIGSGDQFAIAVMSIGKSAHTAVKAAMKLDIFTGGNLQIFEVPEKPEVKSVRPQAPVVEPTEVKAEPVAQVAE
jgi:ATP-dependent protease HslVU (ClpYQ) peptidase subunit